jgi:HEAT repeats
MLPLSLMALSHATTRLLVGSVAAIALVGLSRGGGSVGSRAAITIAESVDTERAPAEPAIAPLPEREPASPSTACEDAIAVAKDAVGRAEAEVTDDDALHLCGTIQSAAAEGAACAARVRDVLATSATCGRAYGAVASCAAPSPSYSPAWTRELLTQATPACRMRLVSSLHQARVVDRELLLMVSQMAERETVSAKRSRLWLALGTLARTAHDGAPEVKAAAAQIDAQIAKKLHGASGHERFYLIETAGNAACDACIGDVRASLVADDPTLRRAAIAALRFRADEASLASLCDALDREPSDLLREHAAWSLRWSASNEVTRTQCLERAAREDASDNVRHAAMQSLFALAERAPTAAAAFAALTNGASAEEIAWLATTPFGEAPAGSPLDDFLRSTIQ